MGSRVNHVLSLLVILFIFSLGISAEHNREASQRVITSPRKNAGGGGVIDGSGLEHNNGTIGNNNINIRVSVSTVALFTLAMAAATGLGAVPFFFLELDPQWAGICNGMAAGVMLAASFDLIQEGQEHGSGGWVVLGILAGGIFILLCKKILEQYGEISMLDIKGADARKAILVVGIMTLHSFGEGSGVGVSFAGSKGLSQGLLVTLAIAVHNIPEGLAVSMVLASRGVAPQKAMLWSVITSLPQPIVAVPSFICADAFNKFLPFATGFAAGCMIWMVMAEVLPDAFKESSASHVASAATLSVAFMEALGALFEHFSHKTYTKNPEDDYGLFVSLLFFGLGPLLGGIALVSLALSFRLQHALLTGISSGIAFLLATWRPLDLLLSSKMNLLLLLFLLALGSASLHIPASTIFAKKFGKNRKKTLELSSSATGLTVSAPALQSVFSCFALALHALPEGVALGAAGRQVVLLPAFLHGFPRGAAAAGCVFGATGSWRWALFSAGVVGLVGPLSAVGAMLAGIGLDKYGGGLDRAMVFACGGMVPGFVGMMRRGVKVDRRKTRVGLVVGVVFAGVWLACTRLLCLHTPYCDWRQFGEIK